MRRSGVDAGGAFRIGRLRGWRLNCDFQGRRAPPTSLPSKRLAIQLAPGRVDRRTAGWPEGWTAWGMDGWEGGRLGGGTAERMYAQVAGRLDGLTAGRMGGCAGGQLYGWKERRLDSWTAGRSARHPSGRARPSLRPVATRAGTRGGKQCASSWIPARAHNSPDQRKVAAPMKSERLAPRAPTQRCGGSENHCARVS